MICDEDQFNSSTQTGNFHPLKPDIELLLQIFLLKIISRVTDHTVVSPRTRDNERNWRLWSQEELGISSRRAAEYNTRAYNDVGLTIAYSRAGIFGVPLKQAFMRCRASPIGEITGCESISPSRFD